MTAKRGLFAQGLSAHRRLNNREKSERKLALDETGLEHESIVWCKQAHVRYNTLSHREFVMSDIRCTMTSKNDDAKYSIKLFSSDVRLSGSLSPEASRPHSHAAVCASIALPVFFMLSYQPTRYFATRDEPFPHRDDKDRDSGWFAFKAAVKLWLDDLSSFWSGTSQSSCRIPSLVGRYFTHWSSGLSGSKATADGCPLTLNSLASAKTSTSHLRRQDMEVAVDCLRRKDHHGLRGQISVMPSRPLRPKDDLAAPDSSDAASDSKLNKRRADQCDGNLPSCSTCIAVYQTECYYDESGEQRRKGTVKRNVQSLQQPNDALDVIVASLKGLPERDAMALLQGLRNGSNPDALAASLRADVRLPHGVASNALDGNSSLVSPSTQLGQSMDEMLFSQSQSREHSTSEPSVDASQNFSPTYWSQIEQDPEFVEHLLSLYFTWIHPFYHFFSRDHFLHDMGHGRTENCSAMLINAIMALSCHYSDRPGARSDPHDPGTAGNTFFAEAKRLLDFNDKSCLTTIQALLVMACRECSQGRESNAYRLLGRSVRMALELGLHLSVMSSGLRAHEIEIRKITFWGIFNLEK
nr:nitrogen assimilation transcription factor nira [Quercus suber]